VCPKAKSVVPEKTVCGSQNASKQCEITGLHFFVSQIYLLDFKHASFTNSGLINKS
jgi:hypothetical protein